MSTDKALQQGESTGDSLDASVRQRRASVPDTSVWVNASAGTGKTKVLTDRVLRLLLPREDGQPGTKPHRIVCLTFTKAAAAEMAVRIGQTLSRWTVMPDEDLKEALKNLSGHTPSPATLQAARQLFVEVLDSPGGLNIMTIHAFCQSILGRFPLEAGLSPNFEVIEEAKAGQLLGQAIDETLLTAQNDENSALFEAVQSITREVHEAAFISLLSSISSERQQLQDILHKFRADQALKQAIENALNAPENLTETDIVTAFCTEAPPRLSALSSALAQGNAGDQKMAAAIQDWLNAPTEHRIRTFETYAAALILASRPEPRSIGKKTIESFPETPSLLNTEVQRILEAKDKIKARTNADLTHNLLMIGHHILQNYQSKKEALGVLDYDDLIACTQNLLKGDKIDASWVLFKLDGGLDHILIDESQDTNPEQWSIVSSLAQEFFAGYGQTEDVRTVFVVGDEKQSIYSFQRAAPREFERMKTFFETKIKEAQQKWHKEDMVTSFRSTKAVLNLVDRVFALPAAGKGLGTEILPHDLSRHGEAGHVEIWPLIKGEQEEKEAPWTPPVTIKDTADAKQAMAVRIADTIKTWLDTGEKLESKGRPIEPGDILILVRTRSALVGHMVKALKARSIPVSGVDRLRLNQSLAVQDMLAMAEFALLPDDDLNLATILKSPFIGLNENQLYDLSYARSASLWDTLRQSDYEGIIRYLQSLIALSGRVNPHEFLTHLLYSPCPAHTENGLKAILSRLGKEALDPIDELVNLALRGNEEYCGSLQRFVHAIKRSDSDIKREMEEAGQAVRIMTIHGAKGLQAPIVFMPDTTRTHSSKRTDRLLWPDKTELNIPIWAPRKDDECKAYRAAFEAVEDTLEDEYRRLLYVAMTRAEDRLYIGGIENTKKNLDDSWYNYIHQAFENWDEALTDDETGNIAFTTPQTKTVETSQTTSKQTMHFDTPKWLYAPIPQEETPPRPLMPSRPSETVQAALSPLQSAGTDRFKRGNLTHTLLQMLPDIAPDEWEAAATRYLASPAHSIPPDLQADIARETIAVLNHPDFAPIFGPGSMAEVPITGMLDARTLISGQIDRLLITDHEIYIVDFKTNRPPPARDTEIPDIYRKQLESYARTMEKIYPDRIIKTALLWTDGPTLMPVKTSDN